MKKPELLAPAGSLEKLKIAVMYGADAVYVGGVKFGLRAGAKNFNLDELVEGINFAHNNGKKVYLTLNIIPHNEDLAELPEYVKKLKDLSLDGMIISDPGIMSIVKKIIPEMEIHLSTQTSITSYATVNFWYQQGISRIILARELSLAEIREIVEKVPDDIKIETFVHGAMCISYSGRCLLSNYMTGRDANRGNCSHPCRWRYHLVEEKRPGEYFPVIEDERGTYFFNSKDLCMIEHIPSLIDAGISALKIEGRMKSAYYVASIVKAYRQAIDSYFSNPEEYHFNEKWLNEIKKTSNRCFTSGFYFSKPDGNEQRYQSSAYIKTYDFIGIIHHYDKNTEIAMMEQKNRVFKGDEIEIFGPEGDFFTQKIEKMWNEDGEEIEVAPHAMQIVKIKMVKPVKPWYIIRKYNKN
jgi:putative protease